MIKRDEITGFLYETLGEELLEKAAVKDTVPNSVQIKGAEEVSAVALGVSASLEFFEQAIEAGANYCIFHHGLHLSGGVVNGRLDAFESRLKLVFGANLTVAGFHYSLDAHKSLGNNAQIIEKLGAKRLEIPFFDEWGFVGEFKSPQPVEKLAKQAAELFQHDIFSVTAGPQKVKRIGVCSGGAKPRGSELFEIKDKKIDLFISGEITEGDPYIAEEIGFNYFAGGHYATEVFGVQALAGVLKEHFGDKLEVVFLDIPTTL